MPENIVYTIEMRGKDSGGVSVKEHVTQAMAKAGAELNRLIVAAGGLDKAIKMSVVQPVVDVRITSSAL